MSQEGTLTMEQYKTCGKCKQHLAFDNFYKATRSKDGLASYCKSCQKEYLAAYGKKNPEKIKSYRSKRQDVNKQYQKNYYLQNKERIDKQNAEWAAKNPDRKKAADKLWANQNKEKVRINGKNYYLRNPDKVSLRRQKRRATLKQAKTYLVTTKDIRKIMRQPCLYCGSLASHIDHIIPLARGGEHRIGNLAAACKTCNLSKNKKFLSEWKLRKGKL
jgi:5-methylcytosine-specific restriction endonuclease McrA